MYIYIYLYNFVMKSVYIILFSNVVEIILFSNVVVHCIDIQSGHRAPVHFKFYEILKKTITSSVLHKDI